MASHQFTFKATYSELVAMRDAMKLRNQANNVTQTSLALEQRLDSAARQAMMSGKEL